jgi:hypothetical protein
MALSPEAYVAIFIICLFTIGVDLYLGWYLALFFPLVILSTATWLRVRTIGGRD